jgi:hypothetical protein
MAIILKNRGERCLVSITIALSNAIVFKKRQRDSIDKKIGKP